MTDTLKRKLLWLIAGRAVVVTLLLGSAILIQLKSPGAFAVNPFFFLIGITYALTALYTVALKFTVRHRRMVDVQLACDAVIISTIVLLTGGVNSNFAVLYALPIIAASTLESRRGGLTVAVLSSVSYVALVVLQYFGDGLLPASLSVPLPAPRIAVFNTGWNLFGFVIIAGLSGYLAEGKRHADEKLARASSQLADLQAFSQHIIDSLTSGLATTDADGVILTFNRAAEDITGIAAAEAIGASAVDVLQLPHVAEKQPRGARFEVMFTRQDGRQIELGLSAAPLITPRGETGSVVTFKDVTEARRLEREARVQQRLAAVGEMAAGIAHEIRNPLASMSGSIQILRQDLPLSPDQSQLMDIVLRESERLNETIRNFLAFARPQPLATSPMDVCKVISETARLLENDAQLTDTHEISVDVPPEEVWFDGDESQIRQIVWNLATNGLRAMPSGGRLRLSVRAGHAGDENVLLSVEDEGMGIGPEEVDGIFQPFRSSFVRGTGLGLSIVQRIVAEYDGEIRVSSERGKGTTVSVRLPLRRAASANATVAGRTTS